MSTEETKSVLLEHLNRADLQIIEDARVFIGKPTPDRDESPRGVVAKSLSENLKIQERLSNLHTGVKRHANKKSLELYQHEASLREDAKDDGWKGSEERTVMCHSDSKWRDLKKTHSDLNEIASYVSSLEWNLKSSANYLTRK